MSDEEKKTAPPTWKELGYDFTQDTTLHGVRLITAPTPYVLRRLAWAIIVLGAVALFTYICYLQLAQYYKFEKIVNVEIIETKNLQFPAVSICNQNYFRRAATFELGIYDTLTEGFTNAAPGADKCLSPLFRRLTNKYISAPRNFFTVYREVSLSVCTGVCLDMHDATCNSVMYNKMSRTCYVTSLTDAEPLSSSDAMILAVREHCPWEENTISTCTFDDDINPLCDMYQAEGVTGSWLLQNGPTSTPDTGPLHDHTYLDGTYLYVEATGNTGQVAILLTRYLYAVSSAPLCMRLYYSMFGIDSHLGRITIMRKETNHVTRRLALFDKRTVNMWELAFIRLGYGLFRLEILGLVGQGPRGDMAIDDVSIGACESFRRECRESFQGIEYMGIRATSASGAACLRWDAVLTQVEADKQGLQFPEGNMTLSVNYCRNPNRGFQPWCFTSLTGDFEHCDIEFCPCENKFRCANGECIGYTLVCNLQEDCYDASDETVELAGCDISVTCDFTSEIMCGYTSYSAAPGALWRRHWGKMLNDEYIRTDAEDDIRGRYAYLDSGVSSIMEGQRITLMSPLQYVSERLTGSCLTVSHYISLYEGSVVEFTETGDNSVWYGRIHIYLQTAPNVKVPLWILLPTGAGIWSTVTIPLPTMTTNFQVLFEGVVSWPYHADMGIDEVEIEECTGNSTETTRCADGMFTCSNGRCISDDKLCNGRNGCFDNSDEGSSCSTSVSVNCSFADSFICGYTDHSDPQINLWAKSDFEEAVTFDEWWMFRKTTKHLLSPWTSISELSCLEFDMEMSERNCEMEVQLIAAGDIITLGRIRKQGVSTQILEVDAQTEEVRLGFKVSCQEENPLRVYIRRVSIMPGECVIPEGEGCFSSNECNFTLSNDCCMVYLAGGIFQFWQADDSGYKVENTQPNLFEPVEPALTMSQDFEFHDPTCLSISMTVVIPASGGSYGSLGVSDLEDPHMPPSLFYFNEDFSGDVQAFIDLPPGHHKVFLEASLSYGGTIHLTLLKFTEGECDEDCESGFLCEEPPRTCIPWTYRCDLNADCLSGEDEWDCEEYWASQDANGAEDSTDGDTSGDGTDTTDPGDNQGLASNTIDTNLPNEPTCYCPPTKRRRRRRRGTIPPCVTCGDDGATIGSGLPGGEPLVFPERAWRADISENLTNIYHYSGHQKEDLIFHCEWQGQNCTVADFRTDVQDYGLCHTFNIIKKPYLHTTETGSSNGLKLIINIEEYQYMTGPQDDSGIKMFVYNQSEVPFIRDLGFAIGPGVHALVATRYTQSVSLGQPWGNCSLFETYSECKRRCETHNLILRCRCRDDYMNITVDERDWGPSDMYIKQPVCYLDEYLHCVHKQNATTSTGTGDSSSCECMEPCLGGAYVPSLSYASLSSSTVNKLETMGLASLKPKVIVATEIQQRTEPVLYKEELMRLRHLTDQFADLLTYIDTSIYDARKSILASVPKALNTLLANYFINDRDEAFEEVGMFRDAYLRDYAELEFATTGIFSRLRTDMFSFVRSFESEYSNNDLDFVHTGMNSLHRLLDAYMSIPQTPDLPRDVFGGDPDCDVHSLFTYAGSLMESIMELIDATSNTATDTSDTGTSGGETGTEVGEPAGGETVGGDGTGGETVGGETVGGDGTGGETIGGDGTGGETVGGDGTGGETETVGGDGIDGGDGTGGETETVGGDGIDGGDGTGGETETVGGDGIDGGDGTGGETETVGGDGTEVGNQDESNTNELTEILIMTNYESFTMETATMTTCLSRCIDLLEGITQWLKEKNSTIIGHMSKLADEAKIESITETLDFYTEYPLIKQIHEKLETVYQDYSNASVTKYEISLEFNFNNIDLLQQQLNHFLSSAESLIEKYEHLIYTTVYDVSEWYVEIFQYLVNLGKFYGPENYLERARNMKLWKKPISSVEDPTNPSEDDPFRIENLEDFVKTQANKMVAEMTTQYVFPLEVALRTLKDDLSRKSQEIIASAGRTLEHYGEYHKDVTVDHSFVKQNFIVVDVFFAQLKYMQILQNEAYKLEDFFASVGGYMGLLLGASAITIFELLDFICYNNCWKINYRKKTEPEPVTKVKPLEEKGDITAIST